MSEDKIQLARKLIDEQHYSSARLILEKIDDPDALKLLARLDAQIEERSTRFTALELGPSLSPAKTWMGRLKDLISAVLFRPARIAENPPPDRFTAHESDADQPMTPPPEDK